MLLWRMHNMSCSLVSSCIADSMQVDVNTVAGSGMSDTGLWWLVVP